jgi:BirA family transcriptional regulator, biotin operon repressor / biotin---[acetyl-CoA-carboxylase] ligase
MSFSAENIVLLDSVDSTNNYAMAMIQKSDRSAIKPVFALEQTQGKGRRGKHWKSHKGANIILSIPVQMQWLAVSHQFQLSIAVALGCRDLLSKFILANLFIKWPNDLFISDRKAGGILIENIVKGTLWQWTIIGIGLNINQQEFEEYNLRATSLKLETGQNFDVLTLAEELISMVLKRIEELKSGNFQKMLEEYNQHLFASNKTVKLKKENVIFQTKIIGVSSSGQLITKDALERRFDFDEVEFKGLV